MRQRLLPATIALGCMWCAAQAVIASDITVELPSASSENKTPGKLDGVSFTFTGTTFETAVLVTLPAATRPATTEPATGQGGQAPAPPKRHIHGTLQDSNKGIVGKVELTGPGGDLQPAYVETKRIGQLKITVLASDAKPPFQGALLDESGLLIATFTVTRPPAAPALNVEINGSAPSKLTLNTQFANFKAVLSLVSKSTVPEKDIKLHFTPLINERGVEDTDIVWTVNDKSPTEAFSLSHAGLGSIEIKASNLIPGKHTSHITLIRGENRQTWTLEINRNAVPDAFEILGGPTVEAVAGDASMRLTLRDTGGASTNITNMLLAHLTRSGAKQPGIQGNYEKYQVINSSSGDTVKRPANISVGPGVPAELEMNVTGIQGAGEYKAKISVSAENAKQVEKEFTILVKDHWRWAAFFIFLGVFISWLIRLFIKNFRPMWVQKSDVRALGEDLEKFALDLQIGRGGAETTEASLLNTLRDRIKKLESQITLWKLADDTAVKIVNGDVTILIRWVQGHRRVIDLPASLTGKDGFEATLETARNFLTAESRTLERSGTIRVSLEELELLVTKALRAELTQKIAALRADMIARQVHISSSSPNQAVELSSLLSRLSSEMVGDTAEQYRKLERIKGDYAALLAADLQTTLNAGSRPVGFTTDEGWTIFKEEIQKLTEEVKAKSLTDPEQAMAQYRGTYISYITELAKKLDVATSVRRQEDGPKIAAEQKQTFDEGIKLITTALQEIATHVQGEKLREAGESYTKALKAFHALPSPPIAGRMGTRPAASEESATAPDFLLPSGLALFSSTIADVPAFKDREDRDLRSASDLRRMIGVGDWILQVVLLVVAILLGIKVLWVGQPIWGGDADYVAAFFWGLGLNEVAFTSITALQASFSK